MRDVRRPATPTLLAWLAAGAGLLSIVSALTPEMADRVELVQGVLPPGVHAAARTLVLALGVGTIWLARGLARRKRRAWVLAVVVVSASAVAHLAQGLDFEEAAVHLGLLIALFRARRQFVAPGDPATIRPLVQVVLALVVGVSLLLTDVYLDRQHVDPHRAGARACRRRACVPGVVAVASPARCAAVHAGRARTRDRAGPRHGEDSLSYFALRRDKTYVFSPSGRSFLAYRVVGGTALVAGDPIGIRPSGASSSPSSSASPAPRAGASRSQGLRARRSRTTRHSASSRSTSAMKP